MEIEIHQQGGLRGLDRRYLVRDGTIEVHDRGRTRARPLAPEQAALIGALASAAADAEVARGDAYASDAMETRVGIRHEGRERTLVLRTGDDAPGAVWDLIGEVGRASQA